MLDVPREVQASFRRELKALAAEGLLVVVRGNRYTLPDRVQNVAGRLQGHASGIAFVIPDGGGQDVFIPASRRGGALHGDRVVARVEAGRDAVRLEGRVVEIRERRSARIVGRLTRDRRGMALVRPFDARLDTYIRVPPDGLLEAADGDMVTVEITRWPGPTAEAAGRIVEVLGGLDDPGVDTEVVLRKHGIPDEHAPDAVAEARARDAAVHPREIAGRTDFRGEVIVTIDGEHARDFDDAISIERRPNGHYWLGVHIADVAHYVREGSALDLDAFERGTSVYFPERAVHMFPHELATGVCSLNPHVDRLVQCCLMEVNRHGDVVRYELHDGVIHSRARMTYAAVNGIVADQGSGDPRGPSRPRAHLRADARAVRDPERPAPPARLDRLRPAGSGGRRRCRGRHRRHRRCRAQHRAPDHRGVHAAGQRDRGRAPRVGRNARALSGARSARSGEGDRVRGVRLVARRDARRAARTACTRDTSSSSSIASRARPRSGRSPS